MDEIMKNKNIGIAALIIALGFIAFLIFVPLNNTTPMEIGKSGSGFQYEQELKDANNKSTIVTIIEKAKCCFICKKPTPIEPEKPLDPEQAMWKLWYTGKDDGTQRGIEFSNQSFTK